MQSPLQKQRQWREKDCHRKTTHRKVKMEKGKSSFNVVQMLRHCRGKNQVFREAAFHPLLATFCWKEYKSHSQLNISGPAERCAGDQAFCWVAPRPWQCWSQAGLSLLLELAWLKCPGPENPSLGGTGNVAILHKWQRCHQQLLQAATARVEMTGEKERDWRADLLLQVFMNGRGVHLVPLPSPEGYYLGS